MSSHTDARSRSGQSTVTVSVAVDRPAMMSGEEFHAFGAHLVEGQCNRRQSGSQVGRDELLIVESDDGNVRPAPTPARPYLDQFRDRAVVSMQTTTGYAEGMPRHGA